MSAVNGPRKSPAVKKNKGGTVTIIVPIITAIISMLLVILGVLLFWKLSYEETYRNKIITELESGKNQVYMATRDIASGEYLSGAVELVAVPSSVITTDTLLSGSDISNLKASGEILQNSIITYRNAYDPDYQNVILEGTRIYTINYLKTDGMEAGDYMDIRLKLYSYNDQSTYLDKIVCSKLEILSKDPNGTIQLALSEADILNLNSAVIEAAGTNTGVVGEIYTGKYPDPANQKKAVVTYDGKGISYTQQELLEAQNKLQNINSGTIPVVPNNPVDDPYIVDNNDVANTDENNQAVVPGGQGEVDNNQQDNQDTQGDILDDTTDDSDITIGE